VTAADDRAARALSFGAIAEDYDRFRPGPPMAALEWILPPGAGAVVDIGAGTGALSRLLVPDVDLVVAVEPDARMAAVLARRVPEAKVVSARAEMMPLRDGGSDAVVGSSMWHWVDEDRTAFEAARVLRPDGVLGLLWSGPDRSHPGLTELLAVAGPPGGGAADRSRWRQVHLPDDAPFSEPDMHTVRWTATVSPDQLVELACTYSRVIVMPDSQKTALRRRLTDVVRHHPTFAGRSRIELPMGCRCWKAVRRTSGDR
jgi:SAM-dependent methyltransferase